jgi:cytidine deaminase
MCDFAHAASSQRVGIAPILPANAAWSSKRNAHPTEAGEMKRPATLGKGDRLLVDAATAAIKQRYRNDWQEVGAALRTRSGKVFTGVNLDAYLGRMAVCAEAVALGRAFVELGADGIETIVAVRHPPPDEKDQSIRVVSPCGACRELIFDYDPKARVIVPNGKSPGVVAISDLLPNKYRRGPET